MNPPTTDPDRHRVIDDLFDGALDQPPEQRSAWLGAHCDDASIRAEVEALLRADEGGGFLERNALHVAGTLISKRIERIGPYRVIREIGRGGMGVVYLCERDDGQYRRRVAIKLLRSSPDPDELRRRFFAERQILASLNHPNIAQLLDGGVTVGGLPFLVMEYVDGVPITAYCDRQRLSIEERLHLFRDVCAAVHHAHQNLVIHRDIKPSNILVTETRRVMLLDFGIAKLLNPTLGPADQPYTRTEWRALTPEYASPEQVRGDTLTTASDVYALGVLLYELLSGRRPHRLTSGSPQELSEIIIQREPVLPSLAVSRPEPARVDIAASDEPPEAIAAERGLTEDRLRRRLAGDLDAIVMMALRKESNRRYSSADLLWEDVQRHLDGLPVVAHHATRWYRARKFIARHRGQVAAVALVTLSLVTGTTVAVTQAAVARRERDRAEQALVQSREVTDFLVRLFRTPAPAGASRDQVTARDMLAAGTARIEDLSGQPLVQAQMLDALGQVNEQMGRFPDAERMLRRALGLRRAGNGNDHVDVALTLQHLAGVVRQQDKDVEALQLAREALAIQQRVLGPRHPDVAKTLTVVAAATRDKAVAESLYRAARDIQRAAGQELPVATTNIALANVLQYRGHYEEAESLLRESVSIRARLMGPDHGGTATSMIFLAGLLQSHRNRPAEAESLYARALAILRPLPPPWLPNLVGALGGMADIASDRGDYVRAEGFAREMLAAHRRTYGNEHPLTTEPMGIVADKLAGQGRYAEAEAMHDEAIAVLERAFGAQHFRVGAALLSRGRVRAAAGRLGDAEADMRRALVIVERSEGPAAASVGAALALLADIAVRRGATAESDSLFARADAVLRPLASRKSPDIRGAYAALADHYGAKGQAEEERHYRQMAGRWLW